MLRLTSRTLAAMPKRTYRRASIRLRGIMMSTCTSCGAAVLPGAHFCASCGKPVLQFSATAVAPAGDLAAAGTGAGPASVPQTASAAVQVRFSDNPFTWVFHQKGWAGSVWILLIGWFFTPLPMTLSFGWMIDAIARRARGDSRRLPRPRDLLHMVRDGLVVWLAIFLIFAVPVVVFGALFTVVDTEAANRITGWVLGRIFNPYIPGWNAFANFINEIGIFGMLPTFGLLEPISFGQLVGELIAQAAGLLLFYIVYVVVATLGFLAGTIRFALSRKVGDYFHPFHNFRLAAANFWRFTLVVLLLTGLHFANTLLLASAIGSILVITFGIWIKADLVGRLGARLKELQATELPIKR
jgi:ribosomal protein L32